MTVAVKQSECADRDTVLNRVSVRSAHNEMYLLLYFNVLLISMAKRKRNREKKTILEVATVDPRYYAFFGKEQALQSLIKHAGYLEPKPDCRFA